MKTTVGPISSALGRRKAKSQLPRNALALTFGAGLMLALVGSRASAQTVAWRVDPNPPSNANNALNSISARSPSDVWAVGDETPSTKTYLLVKHWDGTAWQVVPSVHLPTWDYSAFTGVSALAADDVWAVGTFNYMAGIPPHIINSSVIEHFDGVSWSIVPSPQSNLSAGSEFFLNAVSALSADDVWAVGFGYPTPSSPILPLYEHWDGKAWTAEFGAYEGGYPDLFSVSATSPTDVWASGSFRSGTYDDTYISHWDGANWTRLPTPNRNAQKGHNDLWSIHGITANDAWAVGYGPVRNADAPPYQEQTLIMHWDGLSWKIVPSPNITYPGPGLGSNRLFGVTAVSATDVWAAGAWSDSPNFATRSLVEHWDGVRWSISPTPTVDPQVCITGQDCTRNFLASITSLTTGQVWTAGQYSAKVVSDLGLILDRP